LAESATPFYRGDWLSCLRPILRGTFVLGSYWGSCGNFEWYLLCVSYVAQKLIYCCLSTQCPKCSTTPLSRTAVTLFFFCQRKSQPHSFASITSHSFKVARQTLLPSNRSFRPSKPRTFVHTSNIQNTNITMQICTTFTQIFAFMALSAYAAPTPANFDAVLSNDTPGASAYASPRIVVGKEKREWGLERRAMEVMRG
jgi:hypothetical protein